MIPVRLVMRKELVKTSVNTVVAKAAELMQNHEMGSLLVQREGENVGILTETDIVQKVVARGLNPARTRVGDVMSAPLITIEAQQSVVDADEIMERRRIRHLAVLDRGKIAGLVSVRDLLFPLQFLLAFADVDTEKESALLGREVAGGFRARRKAQKQKKKKSKRPTRKISKSP